MALRSILLAGVLAGLFQTSVDALPSTRLPKTTTPGFAVSAPTAISRKRPRGYSTRTRSAAWAATVAARPTNAIQAASAGSFVADSKGGAWMGQGAVKDRPRGAQGSTMWIHFDPAPAGDLIHGFGQAIAFGIMGAMLPRLTKERIREKEAGIEEDERFEMEDPPDYYGYAEGYVCSTCDNTNEVPCSKCRGKGFFVSESALPRKCGYCAGLGTLSCPECEEHREMLEQERESRRTPLRLPPARDDDIDWPFST